MSPTSKGENFSFTPFPGRDIVCGCLLPPKQASTHSVKQPNKHCQMLIPSPYRDGCLFAFTLFLDGDDQLNRDKFVRIAM